MSAQKKPLRGVLVLALLAIGGIIGMLLAGGIVWDRLFFALTALPLVIGAWRGWTHRQTGRRAPAGVRDDGGDDGDARSSSDSF